MISKNFKRPEIYIFGLLLLSTAFIWVQCSKEEEKVNELRPEINAQAKIDVEQFKAKMPEIINTQSEIQTTPEDKSLYQSLLQLCVDENAQKIITTGQGKPPENARSAVAIQSAERAAYIDASRWIAYLLEWQKHGTDSLTFGQLEAELPPVRVLHKEVAGDYTVSLLVEADIPE